MKTLLAIQIVHFAIQKVSHMHAIIHSLGHLMK